MRHLHSIFFYPSHKPWNICNSPNFPRNPSKGSGKTNCLRPCRRLSSCRPDNEAKVNNQRHQWAIFPRHQCSPFHPTLNIVVRGLSSYVGKSFFADNSSPLIFQNLPLPPSISLVCMLLNQEDSGAR